MVWVNKYTAVVLNEIYYMQDERLVTASDLLKRVNKMVDMSRKPLYEKLERLEVGDYVKKKKIGKEYDSSMFVKSIHGRPPKYHWRLTIKGLRKLEWLVDKGALDKKVLEKDGVKVKL